jgi:2-methylcitrate dehydratase PrpD
MIASQLAKMVSEISYESLPSQAIEMAKLGVLDTVGVTLAGCDSDAVNITEKAVEAHRTNGMSLVFGRGYFTTTENAALLNGIASHALDYDDCNNTMGGHPSVPIVPGLWALAEAQSANGMDFLTAYAIGVEVETAIGAAVNFHHYEKGWHPTSTLGTFGAAAACAHLLKLDQTKTANAIAIAASMAAGIKANFGTMTKPFHVGQCARNGLLAARLAENGMTANPEVFEHKQGFFEVFNGKGNYSSQKLFEKWASPFDLVEPGIAFKQHPCCASTHPAIDAVLKLVEKHNLNTAKIKTIRSWTHPRRFRHTNRPNPKSGLDAKFSVQYCIARAVIHRAVLLEHFEDNAVSDLQTRDLMRRIESQETETPSGSTTEHFFADVEIVTSEGNTLSAFVPYPDGRNRRYPLPDGKLDAKFLNCVSNKLRPDTSTILLGLLKEIEMVDNIKALSQIINNDYH